MVSTNLVRRVTLDRAEKKLEVKFKAGDTVSVHVKIKEGDKERVQIFKGVVIKIQGSSMGKSFTVRKISSGVGVERTFPFVSPSVQKIDVIAIGKVRRSRLFYLRELSGRAARIESELVIQKQEGGKKSKRALKAEKKSASAAPSTPATENS